MLLSIRNGTKTNGGKIKNSRIITLRGRKRILYMHNGLSRILLCKFF